MGIKELIEYHLRKIIGIFAIIGISYLVYLAHLRKGFELDLYITEVAVALTVMVLGLAYWTFKPQIDKVTERVQEEEKKVEKRHDSKKLNDIVFRKLMYVVCLEYYQFFENKFGFCITKDPTFFKDLTPADIGFNIQLQKLSDTEKYFDKMEDVIPALEVGEDYLKQNYAQIYDSWIKIKQELDGINKDQQEFCNQVSDKIKSDLKKHFGINPTLRLLPFEDKDNWAYFSDVVPKTVSLLFNKYGIVDFGVENHPIDNQFYINFGGYRMIGVNKKEKLDLGTIKEIFNNISNNDKLVDEHRDFALRLIKLNNKIDTFRRQLEKKVVNDIDSMI